MNLSSIKHFSYGPFCYPLSEDILEISIRTAKDVKKVTLIWADPFIKGLFGGGENWEGVEEGYLERRELQAEYVWIFQVKPEFKRCRYCFLIEAGKEKYYMMETGFFTPEEFSKITNFTGCFCFPWMNASDVAKPPLWAENTVWYQIFPARFAKGKNPLEKKAIIHKNEFYKSVSEGKFSFEGYLPWPEDEKQEVQSVNRMEPCYGGNLQGITEKLDYLSGLGITGIYLTPVNKSSSQHKYNTDDYNEIDEEFGGAKALKNLVEEAHKRNIRVMLDGVFNHTGYGNALWQDVVKNREKSKYADWFMVNDFGFSEPGLGEKSNARAGRYFSFAFVDYMPKLNTNNPEVIEYFCNICKKWVKEYGIDAIRLDVANEVSHTFCRALRNAMDSVKKDFYIVGEIWHDAFPWLNGKEFDATMNYPLQNAIADFCIEKEKNANQLEWDLSRCFSMYFRQVNRVLFNQMDSHDTIRILNRAGGSKNISRQTLALLFSMPGSVCIYYGTEIMLPGGHDPDNRRCMPWARIEQGAFKEDFDFMQKLISLRKSEDLLRSDTFRFEYDKIFSPSSRLVHIRKMDSIKNPEKSLSIYLNCSGKKVDLSGVNGENILISSNFEGTSLLPEGLVIVRE